MAHIPIMSEVRKAQHLVEDDDLVAVVFSRGQGDGGYTFSNAEHLTYPELADLTFRLSRFLNSPEGQEGLARAGIVFRSTTSSRPVVHPEWDRCKGK